MYDVCSLFETELGLEPGEFFHEVEQDPVKVKDHLKNTGLCDQPIQLSEDLYQEGCSAPILTKGADLWHNIDSILNRIARHPGSVGRPVIDANDQVNTYLKGRIINHIESVSERLVASDKYNRLYSAASKRSDLKEMLEILGEVADKLLTAPRVLSGIFSSMKGDKSGSSLEAGVNAAYISMFIFKNRADVSQWAERPRENLVDIGTAALLRDISIIVYKGEYPPGDTVRHPEKSAAIAAGIGVNPNVAHAIGHHHTIVLDESKLSPPSGTAQLYKDIVVLTDLFIELTAEKQFNENEVIIGLKNLSTKGYLDKDSVTSLGDLYLGKDKNCLIADGLRLIREECKFPDKKAYLWNPIASVPHAIICAKPDCPFIGPLFVKTNRTVKSGLDMAVVPAGTYQHCKTLTKAFMKGGSAIIGEELISELIAKLGIEL